MRGGYRPGAGRKTGSLQKKPLKSGKRAEKPEKAPIVRINPADREKIRELLAVDLDARDKAKRYGELLGVIAKGGSLKPAEKKEMAALKSELETGLTEAEKEAAGKENVDPLTYMLAVMNDQTAEKERRDRMAIAAAPFVHARKAEGVGKKDEKADRAKSAGQGRFAPGTAPLKLVK